MTAPLGVVSCPDPFATRAEAEVALFRYIDGWYNPRRIQEGLGGLSPTSTSRPTTDDKTNTKRLASN